MRLQCRKGAVAMVALAAAAACADRAPAPYANLVAEAPALVNLADGAPVSAEALRGPLVVNYWASWCGPCRSEMPALERLARRLAADGITVIGITIDDDLNLARELVASSAVTFPTYAHARPARSRSAEPKTLPQTVLVDGDGAVAATIAGVHDWDSAAVEDRLRAALGQRTAGAGCASAARGRDGRQPC